MIEATRQGDPMLRKCIQILLLCALMMPLALHAQQDDNETPDYQVRNATWRESPDGDEIVVTFAVYNSGGDATSGALAQLTQLGNASVVLAETVVEPLAGNGGNATGLTMRFPISDYEPGEPLALSVLVTLDEEDPLDTGDNAATVPTITIPAAQPQAQPTTAPPAQEPADSTAGSVTDEDDDLRTQIDDAIGVDVWWLDFEVDATDTQRIALGVGFLAVLMIIALIIKLFLGLFRRTPPFGNWQPPYATMPPLDPNSTYGRRQGWQQYAQNNIVPIPCQTGVIHPRKLLLGQDGEYLSGWRILSLRMTQYDMYGRVSRSHVMASGGMVRRLSRAADKRAKLNDKQIARRMRPAARRLARQFKKKVNQRSAMLPIAIDVRLRGVHGEVRIMFELYDCMQGQPRRIDYWEPEMTVLGRIIYESYTFTVYGQSGNETYRDFRKRLSGDIERVLLEMFRSPAVTPATPAPYAGPPAESIGGTQPIARTEFDDDSLFREDTF